MSFGRPSSRSRLDGACGIAASAPTLRSGGALDRERWRRAADELGKPPQVLRGSGE